MSETEAAAAAGETTDSPRKSKLGSIKKTILKPFKGLKDKLQKKDKEEKEEKEEEAQTNGDAVPATVIDAPPTNGNDHQNGTNGIAEEENGDAPPEHKPDPPPVEEATPAPVVADPADSQPIPAADA